MRFGTLGRLVVGATLSSLWAASCSLANAPSDAAPPGQSHGGQGGVGPETCAEISCDAHASCDDSSGHAICTCSDGWAGTGLACSDEDECALGTDDCDVHATCTNTVGAFDCDCNAGYTGGGTTCVDDDECALGTDDCDVHATCTNTPGAFDCDCNAGYSGDGTACVDDDECTLGTHTCVANALCTNTDGGFDCTCGPGSFGDGTLACHRVLFVDDDEGLSVEGEWLAAMASALGLTPDVETLGVDAQTLTPLAGYGVVVWSIGDRWDSNLTAANVADLTAYLDGGGRLLYAGGHCLYNEPPATAVFAPTYLGLTNFQFNMPTIANGGAPAFADGTGHPVTSAGAYTLQLLAGGSAPDMWSAFTPNLASVEVMLKHRADNVTPNGSTDFANEYLATVNVTAVYRAMTWGFDIGHLAP
ncbi:MAG: hypothetical protein IT373_15455, partial [Polyangiaceae bacterium]|nr:hypothetical protein [Polyangiaceae bacterium]